MSNQDSTSNTGTLRGGSGNLGRKGKSSRSRKPSSVDNGTSSSNPSGPAPPIENERTVKKLKLSKALTIPEDITVYDACKRMASRRVNAVLLTDASALLSGIVTDKDISARVIAEGLRPDQTLVSKIMTRNPTFVSSDSLALKALQTMIRGKFSHLPVVENGEVTAMLNITRCLHDAIYIMEVMAEQGTSIAAAIEGVERQWESNFTGSHAFIEILRERMFQPSLTTIIGDNSKFAQVSPSDPVSVVARKMRDARAHSAIVSSGNKVLGILTSKDILSRVVAQNLSPDLTLVEKVCEIDMLYHLIASLNFARTIFDITNAVMTPDPECATLETTVLEALRTMLAGKFVHLPVLDKDGAIAGCVNVLQLSHAAISMIDGDPEVQNDVAHTIMQKFWQSALANESTEDDDSRSGTSGTLTCEGADFVKASYPSLALGNYFAFKFEDLDGRVHMVTSSSENLKELVHSIVRRIGGTSDPTIMYIDDEGDKVLLASDGDLITAVNHARSSGLKVIRLHLQFLSPAQSRDAVSDFSISRSSLMSIRMGICAGAFILTGVAVLVYLKRAKI